MYQALAEGGDPQAARVQIAVMAGPSGFMLFSTSDHGTLLRIVGQERKAVQYVIGNPLFAVEMTRHAIDAALYAPLRSAHLRGRRRQVFHRVRPPVVPVRPVRGRAGRPDGRRARSQTGGSGGHGDALTVRVRRSM